jgi:hypothetical protein
MKQSLALTLRSSLSAILNLEEGSKIVSTPWVYLDGLHEYLGGSDISGQCLAGSECARGSKNGKINATYPLVVCLPPLTLRNSVETVSTASVYDGRLN